MADTSLGKVVLLAGPSGVGKNTLINYVISQVPELTFAISTTTRPPRPGEQEGASYYFVDKNTFQRLLADNAFIEYNEHFENLYGTTWAEYRRIWSEGKTPVAEVEVHGAKNFKKVFGDNAYVLFVKPPSVEALKERIAKRGSESPEQLASRLDRIEYEMGYADTFDDSIMNDDLEVAQQEVLTKVQEFLTS